MTFKITIELGNEAMSSKRDVIRALREVADRLRTVSEGKIRDVNGNTVGSFEYPDKRTDYSDDL